MSDRVHVSGRRLSDEDTIRHALKCMALEDVGEASEIAGEAMAALDRLTANVRGAVGDPEFDRKRADRLRWAELGGDVFRAPPEHVEEKRALEREHGWRERPDKRAVDSAAPDRGSDRAT